MTGIISKIAREYPEKAAVVQGETLITYRELDARSNAVARMLLERNIPEKEPIALLCRSGIAQVIGLLGIMKSGHPYTPLDISYPPERLRQYITATDTGLILCETGLSLDNAVPVCCFDPDDLEETTDTPMVEPSEMAYYLFTSGSTGVPKKVPTSQSVLIKTLQSIDHHLGYTADDVVLWKTSLCFAFCTTDLFYPLMKGCTVIWAPAKIGNDPHELVGMLQSYHVTAFNTVPAHLEMLAKEPDLALCDSLRTIICAAGSLRQSLVEEILTSLPQCKVFQCYGMTELTSINCATLCEKGAEAAYVELDHWIDGVEWHLLDEQMQETDRGILYIGGITLNVDAIGDNYITSMQTGIPLYRTDDVFQRHNGKLAYVGRADNMLKLNGNRIEPEEIERVLLLSPLVQEVCVTADAATENLIAYVVLSHKEDAGVAAVTMLRKTCSERLPAYMVPSAFRITDTLAYLPNGKLDRQRMDTLSYTTSSGKPQTFDTSEEQAIAELWSQVLGHQDFGAEDDLTLCGGTSIQLMRVRAAIAKQFGVRLSISQMIDNPTVRGQALFIAGRKTKVVNTDATCYKMRDEIPFTPQQRAFFAGMHTNEAAQTATFGIGELSCECFDLVRMQQALQILKEAHPMLCAVLKSDHSIAFREELDVLFLSADDMESAHRLTVESRERLNRYIPEIGNTLVRFCVINCRTQARLLVYFNTIAMDGWSWSIFCQDFERAYSEGIRPEVTYHFDRYTAYLEQLAQSEEYAEAEAFWQEQMQTYHHFPHLPLTDSAGILTQYHGIYQEILPDAAVLEQMKQRAQTLHLTMFSCLLTAYVKMLAFYSEDSDFVICVPVEHRDPSCPDADHILGACSSYVYLNVGPERKLPFYEAAKKLQEQLYTCCSMSVFSGSALTRMLYKNHPEITQSPMVIFTALPEAGDMGKNALWNCVSMHSHTSQSCLEAVVQSDHGEIKIVLNSYDGMFRGRTLENMAEVFRNIIEEALSVPTLAASDKQLIASMNQTQQDLGKSTIQERLYRSMMENSQKTALYAISEQMTYAQLEYAVRCAASVLYAHGAKCGDRIGVILPKGFAQFIWCYAITLCGFVYCPLEHDIPLELGTRVLHHAGITLCITHWEKAYGVPGIPEDAWKTAAPLETFPTVAANAPIAVIHTSGTTGDPKGVLLLEKNLRTTVDATIGRFGVTSDDRAIALTSTAHDLSLFDLFVMPIIGGSVAVPDAVGSQDPAHWYALCQAAQPTVWNSVPTIMEMFTAYTDGEALAPLPSFQLMIHGGEFVPLSLPGKIHAIAPEARIISIGGPTETTIWNICHTVTDTDVERGVIPYGKPMANTHYYLLDPDLQPVPSYVAAEMYIAGDTVAAGYVERPEETAAKFFILPLTGERVYRSGDMGYYTDDGEICILGRKDHQVKLFGKRIETDGIEYCMEQQKLVSGAKVCIDQTAGFLAGFFTGTANPHDLRAHLAAQLPAYMVPKYLVNIEEFPTLPNGKTDRKALLALLTEKQEESEMQTDFSVMGTIRQIFSDVLSLAQVDEDANFFYMGGDSIKAIRIMQQIQNELNCRVSLSDFLKEPTVRSSYTLVMNARSSKPLNGVDFHPEPDKLYEPFPLQQLQHSYLIGRQNDLQLGGITTHGYIEITCDAFDENRFRHALRRLGERHSIFSCAIFSDHQQIQQELPIPDIEVVHLSSLSEEELAEYLRETRREMTGLFMDPSKPPLVSIRITYVTPERVIIHMFLDSLIIDGWSYENLYSELEQLYAEPDKELEPIGVTFRDYVMYRAAFRESEIFRRDREYWMKRIDTLSDPIQIPLLCEPEQLKEVTGNQKECYLSFDLWRRLEKNARHFGVSPFSVLFTSFALVLARWNQKQNFLLSIPEYDRPEFHPDIKKIVGVCTSFLIFDMDNRTHQPFLNVVKQVQKQIWELNEHHSFTGLDVIREMCRRSNNFTEAQIPIVFSSFLDLPQTEKKYLKPYYSETHTSQIYIDIDTMVCGDRVEFNWNTIKNLMDDAMLDAMTALQMQILENAALDREFWMKECILELPQRDRQIIDRSNATDVPFTYQPFAVLLEDALKRGKTQICMVQDDRSITCQELLDMIRCRCSVLLEKGCAPGDRVGILCPRSLEMYAYILACVFLGVTYVPLEYEYPASVAAHCLRETACRVVVTDRTDIVSADTACCVSPDQTGALYQGKVYDSTEDFILVIIHTSGSTGVPKAVRVGAAGLENALLFTNRRFHVTAQDSILAVTNIAHDMSMFDLYGLLLAGGRICVVPQSCQKDAEYWARMMEQEHITLWNSVPAMMEMLLLTLQPKQEGLIQRLRFVISGGDYLSMKTVRTLRRISPHTIIYNVGGPTETTLWNIFHEVTDEDIARNILPYGKPIDNTKYYLLNEKMERVPLDVIGTMYCAGVGVTYGYDNAPEETAKRYFTYPETGERIYCTGDLGCYDHNGEILFKGRADTQVKINGKRIETDGIASVMERYGKISSAFVIADGKTKQITAFYTAEQSVSHEAIREYLQQYLPQYMIPQYYVPLEQIPLNSVGKPDQKKMLLAAEEYKAHTESRTETAPIDELEKELLAICQELLKDKSFSRTSNFFLAGGNSILAIHLLAHFREAYQVPIGLAEILQDPRIVTWHDILLHHLLEQTIAAETLTFMHIGQ